MEIRKDVFWIMEQAFSILLKKYKLLLYYWLINIVLFLIWFWVMKLMYNNFDLSDILGKKNVLIYLTIFVYLIFTIIIQMWIKIWAIKQIENVYKEWEQNIINNIKYWFERIIPSFVTYYHVFVYVYLFPLLALIVWLIFINLSLNNWTESAEIIWIILIIIWAFYLLYSLIYRWTRSIFSIYGAVDKDSYNKDNYEENLNITKNKFRKIFSYLFIFGLTVSIIIWFINQVTTSSDPSVFRFDNKEIAERNYEYFVKNLPYFINSIFTLHISTIVNVFLWWIMNLYVVTFFYLFYKSIESEENNIIELK